MKFRYIFPALFIFISATAIAQPVAKFQFAEETFDFGDIKEEAGPVQHKFVFTNAGDVPLIIKGVRSSCGCTTPAWSKEPVPPGEKGFIVAKYNPRNRPGAFRKSLTITANTDPPTKVLYIKGMVERKQRTPADVYRHKIGALRFRYQALNMGRVTTEKPMTRSFDVYNEGDKPVTFLDKVVKPNHITVSFQPQIIPPKGTGKIIVTYNAKMKNDLGFVSDVLKIYTDEEQNNEKSLRVVASIEEYFPPMTAEQLAKAPRMKFESTEHDFGNIKKGSIVETTFSFTNTGKSILNIRKLKPNCGCTVSQMEKYDYAPGESGTIKVKFNSTGRRGSQQKSVVIFSNDPHAPTQRLIIKARVLEN